MGKGKHEQHGLPGVLLASTLWWGRPGGEGPKRLQSQRGGAGAGEPRPPNPAEPDGPCGPQSLRVRAPHGQGREIPWWALGADGCRTVRHPGWPRSTRSERGRVWARGKWGGAGPQAESRRQLV